MGCTLAHKQYWLSMLDTSHLDRTITCTWAFGADLAIDLSFHDRAGWMGLEHVRDEL